MGCFMGGLVEVTLRSPQQVMRTLAETAPDCANSWNSKQSQGKIGPGSGRDVCAGLSTHAILAAHLHLLHACYDSVRNEVFAPLQVALLTRLLQLEPASVETCHWKPGAGVALALAVTLNPDAWPALTVWLSGRVTMKFVERAGGRTRRRG